MLDGQWTEYQLANAAPEEIVAAQRAGLLEAVTNGTAEAGGPNDEGQKTEAWLRQASPAEVAAAHGAGQLRNILAGRTDEVIAAEQAEVAQRQAERDAFQQLGELKSVLRDRLVNAGFKLPDGWGGN
jgi:hypothetical protein